MSNVCGDSTSPSFQRPCQFPTPSALIWPNVLNQQLVSIFIPDILESALKNNSQRQPSIIQCHTQIRHKVKILTGSSLEKFRSPLSKWPYLLQLFLSGLWSLLFLRQAEPVPLALIPTLSCHVLILQLPSWDASALASSLCSNPTCSWVLCITAPSTTEVCLFTLHYYSWLPLDAFVFSYWYVFSVDSLLKFKHYKTKDIVN